ncbi:MAG: hypothetical protein V1750_00505 [Acidobacteriota bacterium]
MLASLLLASAVSLPPVIADPRAGGSAWQLLSSRGQLPPPGAAGYLLELDETPSQQLLDLVIELGSRGVPVVGLAAALPGEELRPYLDAVALEPAPAAAELAGLAARLRGTPLVCPADGAEEAVELLAAGASAVLVAQPAPEWRALLADLLPEPVPARLGGQPLATALRGHDLATVVGLPAGFAGGEVRLPGAWYGRAVLAGETERELVVSWLGETAMVSVPPLPGGGVVVAHRPTERGTVEMIEVRGEKLPTAAEVLARHHRAAARQERLVASWTARQRLAVRVWVSELSRSFELVLAGPVFFARGLGADWEVAEAWVDGVRWDPGALPDLPLLEPRRPPVPPLAARLDPGYDFALLGKERRAGRECSVLSFASAPAATRRSGRAVIDAETGVLLEIEERASGLPGEVSSTVTLNTLALAELDGVPLALPARVIADDLMQAFGAPATVHRELELSGLSVNPAGFEQARARAYSGPRRMLRDAPSGLTALVPDGRGGRVPAGEGRAAQRFLLAGLLHDRGLATPIPYLGLQLQEFDFRGRGEQLRAFLAGVVNDAAWSRRRGKEELSLRAFLQLLPFTSATSVRGKTQESEELKARRQRVGVGLATARGRFRLGLELGAERWDFARTGRTASSFRTPSSTWEAVSRAEATAAIRGVTLAASVEGGWRRHWRPWGSGERERAWQRGRLAAVYERSWFSLARLHFDAELLLGRRLDRFSAFSPSRFGGLRLRGVASGLFAAERMAAVRGSLALPIAPRVRGEAGIDLAWVRERRSGYNARPVSGAALGVSSPGPWGTLLQLAVGLPITVPGPRSLTFGLFLLRPLTASR